MLAQMKAIDLETFGSRENYQAYLDSLKAGYKRLKEELVATADLLWLEGIDEMIWKRNCGKLGLNRRSKNEAE